MKDKYRAVPSDGFFMLIESNVPQHEEEVIITEEEYLKLLEDNFKGSTPRGRMNKESNKVEIFSCWEYKSNNWEYWDIESGSWKEDLELKEKILIEEYIQKVNSGIEWASSEIDNLQEMVDFDEADAQDEAHLLEAKKYRVALNKIKRSLDYPNLEVELPERPY